MDRMLRLKSSSSSSQEVVLNDEDLLTLILLRVPWTKLKVMKCVSRQWHSLITTPHFRNLLPQHRASGLFIQAPLDYISPDRVFFIPLDDPNTASPFENLAFSQRYADICIRHSCNGLLLCSTAPHTQCYVYNPSTTQLDILPKHRLDTGHRFRHAGLIFDPSKSLHYRVIAFVTRPRSPLCFERDFYIYSSETRTWKASVQSVVSASGMYFNGGVYWKGRMHWLSTLQFESEPVSSLSDCLYFDVEKESLGTFPRPPIGVRSSSRRSLYFGESEDHLHVIQVGPYDTSLSVYEMKSDYSEWFVKYRIDLDPISRAFPEMKEKDIFDVNCEYQYAVNVLSLVRRENFQEDSFLILDVPGKIIRYNLVDRSFKLIWDFGAEFNFDPKINDCSLWDFQICQHIDSYSNV